ncbi:carboxypeptidase-like regulatory domain-containing protein [Maribellus sp. YY47]|uniref:carboxypeptidase-like regulatory domain-containing protein n=1 Tax=Maribellus sp. YY47 TaxID=2929486 RepID=UPI00200162B7|nr:carboxypeptidase-like regulatory domain-containing protein [Maribellus sp. YY47]MCK3685366.1 carboxypeptidase-like regulatory domain-containing protein [Maribellus sp. YY47]
MHPQKKIVISIAILLFAFLAKGQQQDGSVLERRVTLRVENQAIDNILAQISWQAGVYFSYDAVAVKADQKCSVEAENKSLYTVLHQLFDSDKYNLIERENQIIISLRPEMLPVDEIRADSIPVKYFFLSGKLVEDRKAKPVPYASVSVLNQPIGTISNLDGEFLLKLHPKNINDTVVISSMGYAQILLPACKLLDEDLFILKPISIRIKEVTVTAISAQKLLENIRLNLERNYTAHPRLMTAFYRETVEQDDAYINVSEAVLEILKSPYANTVRTDLVRLVKGRKSPDVQPFRWLNFKLQGGPFTIVQLDVVKTMESFISEEFQGNYKYEVSRVVWYHEQPVYVLTFTPVSENVFPGYMGELYVHRESFAIVHASFRFNKSSLKEATSTMIRKKPPKVIARPTYVQYNVNYQQYQGKWHLSTAQASVKFKVKSKRDRLNSEFHSVSDLLITNIQPTELKRFPSDERFNRDDVFVERLGQFDEKYWENYNIIKPDEDLRNAFKEK